MTAQFKGRTVLVTGAGGSIGAELCRKIVSDDAERLVMVSLTEAGLYTIDKRLRQEFGKYRDTKLVPILGTIGDEALMNVALKGVDIVVHAAAHKHVPLCEANPLAAIENNVLNTFTLMKAALDRKVKQFCLISTDKAVKPASVMGATKRLAELLLIEMNAQPCATHFFAVRFGNVIDSAGSVLPLWREQIAAGGPLTLTDVKCERFFISIQQAVGLVCDVIAMNPVGGTFVRDMGPPRRLVDIALELIRREPNSMCEIEIIGLRPGEKLTEELHYGGEIVPTECADIFCVREGMRPQLDMLKVSRLSQTVEERASAMAHKLLWELVE